MFWQVPSFFIAFVVSRSLAVDAVLYARSSPRGINGRSGSDSPHGNGAAISDDLPIQPQITPALAVSGVILILTGTAYLMIGIKNKRLHIFFSAAYLTSLAITVLLVHLLDPPISNAVQGAYLVAVVMPGLILGVTSLLIEDITEGLGCLLGGFCLSMWLLVMKPGGIIDGSASKVIFISIFTIAAYALSFRHHLLGPRRSSWVLIVLAGLDSKSFGCTSGVCIWTKPVNASSY